MKTTGGNMKKVAVALAVVGLVSVLGFASVTQHLSNIADLVGQYSAVVQWAGGDPASRYISAAIKMGNLVEEAESDLALAIKEADTVYEAKAIIAIMYGVAGMHVGAEGMISLDIEELTVAVDLIKYATSRAEELTP